MAKIKWIKRRSADGGAKNGGWASVTRLGRTNLGRLCAGLAVMLALCFALLIDAVKHGPAAALAEAEHAASHHAQAQAESALSSDMSPIPAADAESVHHHSVADHDHTPAVTLLAAAGLTPAAPHPEWALVHLRADGLARGGLPRPPRAAP